MRASLVSSYCWPTLISQNLDRRSRWRNVLCNGDIVVCYRHRLMHCWLYVTWTRPNKVYKSTRDTAIYPQCWYLPSCLADSSSYTTQIANVWLPRYLKNKRNNKKRARSPLLPEKHSLIPHHLFHGNQRRGDSPEGTKSVEKVKQASKNIWKLQGGFMEFAAGILCPLAAIATA